MQKCAEMATNFLQEKEFYKNQINETIDKLDDTELLVYLFLFISAKIKSRENEV